MVARKTKSGKPHMTIGSAWKPASASKDVLAFKRAADAYVRKATVSAKAANQTLVKLGTHDSKGNLTKHYK